jgi:rhodanese-related sulfurtransferase/glyoxylase-like metal-dependent hydrolase (beta-lactamase superfamily II)
MIFKQFYLNCLAHASYLIGDESTRDAVVVDPRRDVQQYLDEADRYGLTIRHVFLTHFHADFIAGHLELRDKVGASIRLGARAAAEYSFTPMKTGDVLELGRVRLVVLETPGHTAESISILVYDAARDASAPYAVLTGDTLFVGDVGRPDLRASLGWSATDLGRLLYHSTREQLLPLPDKTLVYPAHGAGSLCGKHLSKETFSTIGDERRSNYALQPMSEENFLALVTADQPDAPSYFTYDAVLNARERPTLEHVLERERQPLALDSVLTRIAAGAQPLDVRDPREFAPGHLTGSINIGLNGQFATWAGTVLDRTRPIVIIAPPGREAEAATRLGRIGLDNVVGYLDGGMQALENRDELLAHTPQTSPSSIARWVGEPDAPFLLDVRTPNEWQSRHIEGSVNIPLSRLMDRLAQVPRNRPLVVFCAGGYRSSIAASLLQKNGYTRLTELTGGMAAWSSSCVTS